MNQTGEASENQQAATFKLEVEFDAANLSFEDIALVQSRVMSAMLAEAAQGLVERQEPQGIGLPHVKLGYSRHSKGHTKYTVAKDAEDEGVAPVVEESADIAHAEEATGPEIIENYLYVDGYPPGYRPPRFSKSYSKFSKVIIGF